jgi:hypothetical protein
MTEDEAARGLPTFPDLHDARRDPGLHHLRRCHRRYRRRPNQTQHMACEPRRPICTCRPVNTNDENRRAELARRMVAAEIEDALTYRADEQPTAEHMDLATLMHDVATSGDAEHVLIEVTAIAGEAIMRLSRELGEDPRATLEWIASTREWRRPR